MIAEAALRASLDYYASLLGQGRVCVICCVPFPEGLLYGTTCERCTEKKLGLMAYGQASTFDTSKGLYHRHIAYDRMTAQDLHVYSLGDKLG